MIIDIPIIREEKKMDKLKEIADIITSTNGDDDEEKEMMIWQICGILDVEMKYDEDED